MAAGIEAETRQPRRVEIALPEGGPEHAPPPLLGLAHQPAEEKGGKARGRRPAIGRDHLLQAAPRQPAAQRRIQRRQPQGTGGGRRHARARAGKSGCARLQDRRSSTGRSCYLKLWGRDDCSLFVLKRTAARVNERASSPPGHTCRCRRPECARAGGLCDLCPGDRPRAAADGHRLADAVRQPGDLDRRRAVGAHRLARPRGRAGPCRDLERRRAARASAQGHGTPAAWNSPKRAAANSSVPRSGCSPTPRWSATSRSIRASAMPRRGEKSFPIASSSI